MACMNVFNLRTKRTTVRRPHSVRLTNDILLSLDRGDNVFLLLLDLSAAFDTVNHSLLLSRLENSFGIRGTVLHWFHSYLSSRSQFVEIKDTESSVRDLTVFSASLIARFRVLFLYKAIFRRSKAQNGNANCAERVVFKHCIIQRFLLNEGKFKEYSSLFRF